MEKKMVVALSVGISGMIIAVCLMLYPILSSMYIDSHQAKLELNYEEQVSEKGIEELQKAKEDAISYNTAIKPGTVSDEAFSVESQIRAAKNYENILNVNGDSIMGFIEIPKIDVNLPIYHGTDDNILERGIGHLVGSSVPVGGKSTHAVLTGHSGMASKRLFSDLKDLDIGDRFIIRVLGDTLTYQVDDISVVLPHEVGSLRVVEGEDYVTLITCTPYAVNTHRLLVRGKRVYPEDTNVGIQSSTHYTKETQSTGYSNQTPVKTGLSTRNWGMLKGIIMGFVFTGCVMGAVAFIMWVRRRK